MTYTGAHTPADWVACLVLAVCPPDYAARVAGGVRSAEKHILDDPVLVDMARVATAAAPDPLAGDLDDVAGTLLRELLDWSLSPARNPAPRSTFCLLVVHPDLQAADQVARRLAATSTLSRLPVVFRVAEAAGEDEVARIVLDAVDVTARGIERAPEFSLTRRQLRELAESVGRPEPVRPSRGERTDPVAESPVPGGRVARSPGGGAAEPPVVRDRAVDRPTPAPRGAGLPVAASPVVPRPLAPPPPAGSPPAGPPPAGPPAVPAPVARPSAAIARPVELSVIEPRPAQATDGSSAAALPVVKPFVAPVAPVAPGGGRHAALPDPQQEREEAPAVSEPTGPPEPDGPSALQRFVGATRSLFARRVVPSSNVEVIETLSERGDRVSMLYLVMVVEPVRPSRRVRERRSQVALELTRALMSCVDQGSGPWFVRAFTGDRQLQAGPPLPGADDLRIKDFPERWGAYFELYECVEDLRDTLRRDRESFQRRGGRAPDAFVVFLASEQATAGADRDRRLSRLREEAVTVWMSFSSLLPVPNEQAAGQRLYFLRDHEDVVGQTCMILLAEERLARSTRKAIER